MRLSAPLRIAEVAALLNWTPKRTKRWLLKLRDSKGLELEGGGPSGEPYSVTLSALARACPDVFEPPPGLESRVDELAATVTSQGQQLHQAAVVIGVLRKRLDGTKALSRVA